MFKNLLAEMARNGVKKKTIATVVGISEKTLNNKIKGVSEFYWSEVNVIHSQFFPETTIEYLFAKG